MTRYQLDQASEDSFTDWLDAQRAAGHGVSVTAKETRPGRPLVFAVRVRAEEAP